MSGIQAPPGFRDMRLVLLQHGGLASLTGKTGLAMLRHRAGPIVAVIDPHHAGQSLPVSYTHLTLPTNREV